MTADRDTFDRQRLRRNAQMFVFLGSRIHRWAERRSPENDSSDLTFSQMSALYLIQNGIETAGAIAKEMQITPRAVTSMVDVLIENDLITRKIDPADRRRAILKTTPKGLEVSKAIEETALFPLSDFLSHQSREDCESLENVLGLMAKFVETIPSIEK